MQSTDIYIIERRSEQSRLANIALYNPMQYIALYQPWCAIVSCNVVYYLPIERRGTSGVLTYLRPGGVLCSGGSATGRNNNSNKNYNNRHARHNSTGAGYEALEMYLSVN